MAENPCPVLSGGHRMLMKGSASRVDDDATGQRLPGFYNANFYQCSGCSEYLIATGSPHNGPGHYIADYFTQGAIVSGKSQNAAWVFRVNKNLVRYIAASSLPGYTFV